MIFGDFNSVRCASEREGSNFGVNDTFSFNNFIADSGLFDVQLGGKSFTWFNKSGS